jgi:hypothetical protein
VGASPAVCRGEHPPTHPILSAVCTAPPHPLCAGRGGTPGKKTVVAVKLLKMTAKADDRDEFIRECEAMLALKGGANLCAVHGVSVRRRPWLCIIEFLKLVQLPSAISNVLPNTRSFALSFARDLGLSCSRALGPSGSRALRALVPLSSRALVVHSLRRLPFSKFSTFCPVFVCVQP